MDEKEAKDGIDGVRSIWMDIEPQIKSIGEKIEKATKGKDPRGVAWLITMAMGVLIIYAPKFVRPTILWTIDQSLRDGLNVKGKIDEIIARIQSGSN